MESDWSQQTNFMSPNQYGGWNPGFILGLISKQLRLLALNRCMGVVIHDPADAPALTCQVCLAALLTTSTPKTRILGH